MSDCEIPNNEFNLKPHVSPFAKATLDIVLKALEISVTTGESERKCDISYPSAERYAENLEGLVALLEEVGADFE